MAQSAGEACENQDQQSPPLQILLLTARQDHHALLSPSKSFSIEVPSHHADDKYSLRSDFLKSLPERALDSVFQ